MAKFKNRDTQYPADRILQPLDASHNASGSSVRYRVSRDEGNVYNAGTELNADMLNAATKVFITAGTATALTCAIPNYVREEGDIVYVKTHVDLTGTSSVTLNVNNTGALIIYFGNNKTSFSDLSYLGCGLPAGTILALVFTSGVGWQLLNIFKGIINNLTTTISGNPLDATQGKVLNDNKAPNNHASTATTYGVGTDTSYGHVKLNTSTLPSSNGTAAAGASGKAADASHVHPSSGYDIVIRTQAEFDALILNSTWFGAKSVAFQGSFTKTGTGINIPSNVIIVDGFDSTLKVTNFSYNGSSSRAAIYGNGTILSKLRVTCEGSGTVCAISIMGDGEARYCTATATAKTTSLQSVYAFNCNYTQHCIGTATLQGYGTAYGFNSGSHINSFGTAEAENSGTGSYSGFAACNKLTNCIGWGVAIGSGSGIGFNNCNNLTNCHGGGTSSTGSGYGFSDCFYAVGCSLYNSASTALWGGTNTKCNVRCNAANGQTTTVIGTIPGYHNT